MIKSSCSVEGKPRSQEMLSSRQRVRDTSKKKNWPLDIQGTDNVSHDPSKDSFFELEVGYRLGMDNVDVDVFVRMKRSVKARLVAYCDGLKEEICQTLTRKYFGKRDEGRTSALKCRVKSSVIMPFGNGHSQSKSRAMTVV